VPLRVLGEPLILLRDEGGGLRLLSNACTHRGMLVVTKPCRARELVCGYHGRAFGLDGSVLRAPGFEAVDGFPDPSDRLAELPLGRFDGHLFGSPLGTAEDFEAALAHLRPSTVADLPAILVSPEDA